MAYVYVLPNAEHTAVKVGVSIDVPTRMDQIGAAFDIDNCTAFKFGSKPEAFHAEHRVHRTLKSKRVEVPYKDGCTEWFAYDQLEVATSLLKEFAVELGVQDQVGVHAKPKATGTNNMPTKAEVVTSIAQPILAARKKLKRDIFSEVVAGGDRYLVFECGRDEFCKIIRPFGGEAFHKHTWEYSSYVDVDHSSVSFRRLRGRVPVSRFIPINSRPKDIGLVVPLLTRICMGQVAARFHRRMECDLGATLEGELLAMGPWQEHRR